MKSWILISMVALAGIHLACGKDEHKDVPITPPKEVSFTAKDATNALNYFNKAYYDPAKKLYFPTTEKNGVAAIWTQAIYWDMIMNAYLRTGDDQWKIMIRDVFEGNYQHYDHFNWENRQVWFIHDDMMWWIISLARAYQITGTEEYLNYSKSGFERVWNESYDAVDGGMWWDFKKSGKNACINFPTVIAAATLYNITEDEMYLTKAKSIFEWGANNLYDSTKGRVADNNVNGNKGWSDYTYNQGTFIGAATLLYKITGDSKYLHYAVKAADYTKMSMCDGNGIMPPEGDWNEQGVLKAIFGHYIMNLVNEGKQDQYLPWLRKNINLAWGNRDAARGITYRNYNVTCPTGVVQSYESSSTVMLMQVCPPGE